MVQASECASVRWWSHWILGLARGVGGMLFSWFLIFSSFMLFTPSIIVLLTIKMRYFLDNRCTSYTTLWSCHGPAMACQTPMTFSRARTRTTCMTWTLFLFSWSPLTGQVGFDCFKNSPHWPSSFLLKIFPFLSCGLTLGVLAVAYKRYPDDMKGFPEMPYPKIKWRWDIWWDFANLIKKAPKTAKKLWILVKVSRYYIVLVKGYQIRLLSTMSSTY